MKIITRLLPLVFLMVWGNAYAAGEQTLTKILLTSVVPSSGEAVNYRLTLACNSLTSDCGTLTVTDTLPLELEAVSCFAPAGFTVNTCAGSDINITKDAVYNGGDSFNIDINTIVKIGTAAGAVIANTATAVISAPIDPANASLPSTAASATVAAPSMKWELRKARTSPATNLLPTWDTDVSYQVKLCSLTAEGNVSITNAKMIDDFPANAVVINAGGAVQVGNQLTWNLGNLDLATLYAGGNYSSEQCISQSYTLKYPFANFPEGTEITNTLSRAGTPSDGVVCDTGVGGNCEPVVITELIGIPTPGAGLSKSAYDVLSGAAGSPMSWSLNVNVNNSNAPVPDLVVYEKIPATPAGIEAISVTNGQWNSPATTNEPAGSNVQADIAYSIAGTPCDDAGTAYVDLVINVLGSAAITTYPLPANATCVRWKFTDLGADGPAVPRGWAFTTSPVLEQKTENVAGPYPIVVENCLFATYTEFNGDPGNSGDQCGSANIEEATPAINFQKAQISGSSSVDPGDEIQYRLIIQHNEKSSTGATVNPVIMDLLPAEFEFVSWDSNNVPAGKAAPNMEKIDDYDGTGRTLLRFSWADTAPANSIQIDGSAGVANAASFEETEIVDVIFTIKIKAGTPAATYTNTGSFIDNSGRYDCTTGGATTVDSGDLDGDNDAAEISCFQARSLSVRVAAVLGGSKWIKGDPSLPHLNDPVTNAGGSDALCPDNGDGYTRYPCVAQTQHGGDFSYLLQLTNTGNEKLTDYIGYDVLPAIGDTGVGEPLAAYGRGTTWSGFLKEALVPANAYTQSIMSQAGSVVEYSIAASPCRPEVSSTADESGWQGACDNTWAASVSDFSKVTAFRIKAPFTDAPHWEPANSLEFNVNMQAPASGLPSIPGNAAVWNPAWNSIAHRATQQSNAARLATAEPRQVGIVLPEGYRLGNLVWLDSNADGIANDGEAGIANVELTLFKDSDGIAGASAGDTHLGTTTTDIDGHYAFGGLPEGNYYVMVASPATQSALLSLVSSSQGEEANPNDDIDNNDNGVTTATIGVLTGLASGIVTLGPDDSEPDNETLRSGNATDDDGDAYPDQLSNKSVDFGFRQLFDFGDSKDPAYPTLNTSNGAKHKLGTGVYLGSCVDGEEEGQPSDDAKGDDATEGVYTVGTCFQKDDEDGVTFPELTQGEAADLTIFANAECKLNAWIDWNGNGDWADAGDQIANDVDLVAGNNTLSITVPENIPETPTHTRFRCSTAGGDLVTGMAEDGEVEDYTITAKLLLADLELVKVASVDKLLAGETFTYTLTLSNKGLGKAKNVVITDLLPLTQVDHVSNNPSVGAFSSATGDWTIPLLLPTEQAILEIVVEVKAN